MYACMHLYSIEDEKYYACMYVSMHVCMYVHIRIYVRMYECMHVCICIVLRMKSIVCMYLYCEDVKYPSCRWTHVLCLMSTLLHCMHETHAQTHTCVFLFFLCIRKVLQSAIVCAIFSQIHSTFSPAPCRPLHPLARTLLLYHSQCTHTSWLLRICTPASRSAPPAARQRRRRWQRQTPALHGGASRNPRLTRPLRRCRPTPAR
jgi:hypothetical protein